MDDTSSKLHTLNYWAKEKFPSHRAAERGDLDILKANKHQIFHADQWSRTGKKILSFPNL